MNKQASVSLIVPLFNEKECIQYTVKELSNFFNSLQLDYEIIVVDDGSTDGSSQIVDGLCKTNLFLRAIHFYKNKGIGAALRTGFDSAENDIIVYTDSDLPVSKNSFKDALDLLNKTHIDMVIGHRTGSRESSFRVIYSFVYNFIIRQIFRMDLHDINCPMKVFKRNILESLGLKSNGPFIDAELLVRAKSRGFKISELKVTHTPRGIRHSKFASPKKIMNTIFKIFSELIKLYPELKLLRSNGKKINH